MPSQKANYDTYKQLHQLHETHVKWYFCTINCYKISKQVFKKRQVVFFMYN